MVKLVLLSVICWLLIISLLALIAVLTKGGVVLRRQRLWQFIAEKEGIDQARIIFLFSSIISIFLSMLFLLLYFLIR
jgi:uncharacterized membrane protein YidH (DUF202 family)